MSILEPIKNSEVIRGKRSNIFFYDDLCYPHLEEKYFSEVIGEFRMENKSKDIMDIIPGDILEIADINQLKTSEAFVRSMAAYAGKNLSVKRVIRNGSGYPIGFDFEESSFHFGIGAIANIKKSTNLEFSESELEELFSL